MKLSTHPISPVAHRKVEASRDVLVHNPALDGVRGLAIILVMLFHLLYSNPVHGSRVAMLLGMLTRTGWIGVDLFFALSGFLLTGILFDSLGDRRYFRNFYLRRLLRIAPLYYGTLFVLWIYFHAWPNKLPLGLVALYLQNTSLWWHHVYPSNPMVWTLQAYWSLAVEEQFYLAWPIIVFLVRRRTSLMWVSLAGALLAPLCRGLLLAHGASYEALLKLTFCRQDSLLCGAWLALAIRGTAPDAVLRYARVLFFTALAACIAIAVYDRNFDFATNPHVNRFGYSLLALAGTALIGMALRKNSTASVWFAAPSLRWFGRYSYGLYLWHWIVVALTADLGADFFAHRSLPAALVRLARAVAQLCIILPLAIGSYHLYEKQFLKLKRFFNYDRSASVTPV